MKLVEKNKIYNEDCLVFLKNIPNNYFDLIIADPPYNLNKDFGNKSDKWKNIESWIEWSKSWIDECIRVLKPSGSIFIYGIHNYLCYLHVYLLEKNMKYRRQFIWYYENGFSTFSKSPAALYEPILWFSKSNEYTYIQIREPYKSQERLKYKVVKNGKVWKPNPNGKHAGDVWCIPTLAGKRFSTEKVNHPTQKPIKLCNRIINHFSNPNEIIFVPFAGSGSECLSSIVNNRDFIATEINKKYIDIANKRISDLEESNQLF